MMRAKLIHRLLLISICWLLAGRVAAQFADDFNGSTIPLDPKALSGWCFYTGAGAAVMDFKQGNGYASIFVDATHDLRNVWWALIRRGVSAKLDLNLLTQPDYELRIETRVRTNHAPRRINLHVNTQRTTNFHSNLMEYDLADTNRWHTISMTTHNLDAGPGDTVYAQLALMDWGLEKYRVDIDYFKVDVVNIRTVSSDLGNPVPYHPPSADPAMFNQHLAVAQDATIDLQYPEMNFNQWSATDQTGNTTLLSVGGSQRAILRWDLHEFSGKQVIGAGLLELTTFSLQRSPVDTVDFGLVRVVEILTGNPDWHQTEITLNGLCQGLPINQVLNPQMIIDIKVAPECGGKNFITISNPALQRLLDGKTLGLALCPLGAVNATFYALENQGAVVIPKLHFSIKTE